MLEASIFFQFAGDKSKLFCCYFYILHKEKPSQTCEFKTNFWHFF